MIPTAASSPHCAGLGRTQVGAVGTAVTIAPPRQKAAKISHEPSVFRTSRIVATAAPDKIADPTPTICQGPNPSDPGGAIPVMTRATPVVVSPSATIVAFLTGSPRKS